MQQRTTSRNQTRIAAFRTEPIWYALYPDFCLAPLTLSSSSSAAAPPPHSGAGRLKARGQAPADRGQPGEEEEGGDGEDAADAAGAQRQRVGPDSHGDGGPPPHQRPGRQLEAEAQVPGNHDASLLSVYYIHTYLRVHTFTRRPAASAMRGDSQLVGNSGGRRRLARGHLDTQQGGAGDRTSNLPVKS